MEANEYKAPSDATPEIAIPRASQPAAWPEPGCHGRAYRGGASLNREPPPTRIAPELSQSFFLPGYTSTSEQDMIMGNLPDARHCSIGMKTRGDENDVVNIHRITVLSQIIGQSDNLFTGRNVVYFTLN